MEKIFPMLQGEENPDNSKQNFRIQPHTTWDNYFSGCKILNWLGKRGFGATMTCHHDRLPSAVPAQYLHKKRTDTDFRLKAARFHKPVDMVKRKERLGTCSYKFPIHVIVQHKYGQCN